MEKIFEVEESRGRASVARGRGDRHHLTSPPVTPLIVFQDQGSRLQSCLYSNYQHQSPLERYSFARGRGPIRSII